MGIFEVKYKYVDNDLHNIFNRNTVKINLDLWQYVLGQ